MSWLLAFVALCLIIVVPFLVYEAVYQFLHPHE